VVPAYDEETSLSSVVHDLKMVIPLDQIVVVDDGSSDKTGEIAKELGVPTLSHLINRGQGAALATGIEYALSRGADIIVTFDADGQHRPLDIEKIVTPIIQGRAEIVLGNRFSSTEPEGIRVGRHLILKLGVLFTRIVSGIRVSDCHNGLRALSNHAAQVIQIKQDRMAHASEILDEIAHKKLTFVEVPVKIRYTQYSLAKGQKTSGAFYLGIKFLLSKLLN